MESDMPGRTRDVVIKVLGRPLILGFRESSVVVSMPGIMNGHITLMKYADPNHQDYGKLNIHTTNLEGERRNLLSPISEEDFGRKMGYLQDYVKSSEISPEDPDFARENFLDLNDIGRFVSIEQKKRRMYMTFNNDSIENALKGVKVVKGKDILGSGANTYSRRIFIQESDPDNVLISTRNRNIMINKKTLMRKTAKALDFHVNDGVFDILK